MSQIRIHLGDFKPTAAKVELTIDGFMGDGFWKYKAVADRCGVQARKDANGAWRNFATIDAVPMIVEGLRASGVRFEISDEVSAMLAERATQVRNAVESASERIKRIVDRLAETGHRLFKFQEVGVDWLAPRSAAILADEMGLGKTVQGLVAIPDNAPVVVVCPQVAKLVWGNHASEWRPEFKASAIDARCRYEWVGLKEAKKRKPDGPARQFVWPKPGEIVIVNYDILPDECGVPSPGTVLIADEAHALKTSPRRANTRSGSLRTARFRGMAAAVRNNGGKVWLITGTPLMNADPIELWNVLAAAGLERETFGSFVRYKKLWNARDGRFGLIWGNPSPEIPELLKRVMLRRRREEVLPDLPRKIWNEVEVNDIDPETIAAMDSLMRTLAEKGITLERLEDIDQLPAFEETSEVRRRLATAKIPAAVELVESYEAANEPLVVFGWHRAAVDVIASRPGWRKITGDESSEERNAIEQAFQRGELKGVAGTIQAMGVSITLTRAANLLFVDLAYTPDLNKQAEDRCCRIGQTRGVTVTRLIASHEYDKRVCRILARKQTIIDAAVEAAAVSSPAPSLEHAERLDRAAKLNGKGAGK